MILNTGARTDTAQYFSKWLLKRFEEGYVYTRNPLFPNKVTRYELSPDKIDAVLFCSKNYAPILPRLREITDQYRTYFHYTITAYGRDIEPGVPSVEESIRTLIELEKIVGRGRIAWRYDPVLLTDTYTVERHLETFAYMAEQLAPHIDRCIFSFVEMYKKLETNMPELVPLTEDDKQHLAEGLGATAAKYGMRIQTCGTNGDYSRYGIRSSGCATLEILGRANGCEFRDIKHKGMREGCHCIESRDIGAYDTCLNGCKYCYANKSPQKARENYKLHDPASPLLIGHLEKDDVVIQGNQKSFLLSDVRRYSLFDDENV
ncbi:MAG TPA: DUF1848 domain-containing protein [Candidatus Borkfalkia excrementigallinarum]|uniref:DUF1848 domain-containing protein n=1 Tax=Candidatus Borkfalkia excrementigallinarum TaxID=2838506 RepID=A0A9D1ZUH9_9FIRM|nr:DUF1848 domain-containing protein [Candidatus Borkfalkia excrementigallinarum]